MKTSRLKSVIIAILALVNVFLLALLTVRRAQQHAARSRAETRLVQFYAASGVELSPALVPDGESRLASVDPARDLAAEAAFAEAILGPCAAEEAGGGIYRYLAGSGQCLLRSSGAVEASLDRAVGDPEDYFKRLFSAYGYAALSSDLNGGSGSVIAVRILSSGMIFNAELELRFFQNRLLSVTGTFVPAVEPGQQDDNVDSITALARFLDYSNANGEVCTAVTDVRGGYLVQSTASAFQRLIPAWAVTTDVNRYYVNMLTGEVTREA